MTEVPTRNLKQPLLSLGLWTALIATWTVLWACSAEKSGYVIPYAPPSEPEGVAREPIPPVAPVEASKAPSCESASICYDQALARLAAGDRNGAETGLRRVRQGFPDSPEASQAAFVLGRIVMKDSFHEASVWLALAAEEIPSVADYTLIELARGYRTLEIYSEASLAYARLVAEFPESLLRARATFEHAMVQIESGDCQNGAALLDGFIRNHPEAEEIPSALEKIAECAEGEGDSAASAAALRRLAVSHPVTSEGRRAFEKLAALRKSDGSIPDLSDAERMDRARILYDAGAFESAITEYQRVADQKSPQKTLARFRTALALTQLKRYDEARPIFEEIASGNSKTAEAADSLHWLARIGLRIGDEALLVASEKRLASRFPESTERAKSLYYLGVYYEDRDDSQKALESYQRVVDLFRSGSTVEDAAWRMGWMAFQKERFEEAARRFEGRLSAQPTPAMTQQYLYWIGRSLEKAGQSDRARGAYGALCAGYPRGYYCHLAAERAGGSVPVDDAKTGPFAGAVPDSPTVSEPLLPSSIESETHYKVAQLLRQLGMAEAAARHVAALVPHYKESRAALAALSRTLYDLGDYAQSYHLLRNYFADVMDRGGDQVPFAFWEQAYPQNLVHQIRQTLLPGGPDPLLVASVMREESAFNRRAISKVGAIGLMQLMPYTAEWVANQTGFENYAEDRLFEAETSIRLGGWYLGHLASRWENNPVFTIASYNAGPDAVGRWVKTRSAAPDEFVESIPFTETRNFTKRVLRSYQEFQRVGGLKQAAALGEIP